MKRTVAVASTEEAIAFIETAQCRAIAKTPPAMVKKLENLKASDKLLVYHGTSLQFAVEMVNGFDATETRYRYYGGPRHRGLFVSPDEKLAERFASQGEIILELLVPAKQLHGVDYSGNIGREQRKRGTDMDWIAEKYPNSFRPYLTYTMLQNNEPQGLLVGLVKPTQIRRIRYKKYSGSPKWYSRRDFLKLGLKSKKGTDSYGPDYELEDIGWDLSNPSYTLDQFLQMMADIGDYEVDQAEKVFRMYVERGDDDRVLELVSHFGIGKKARESFLRKAKKAWT